MAAYNLFGLNIESEIELLSPKATGEIDVNIRFGSFDSMTEDALIDVGWVQSSKSQAVVTIPEIGKFYIHDGEEIIMDILPDSNLEQVRMYLLGTCMGAILQQRGIVPLHGSCVCKDDKAIIITGESGAGKSTLAAEFLSRGYKLMSDDITPVNETDGVFLAQSTYPGQKLWQDTIDRSNSDNRVVGNIIREDNGREKFQLNAGDSFINTKVPLKYGVVLIPGSDELIMDEVIGFAKTDILMRNLYRGFMVGDKEGKSSQLKTCIRLGEQMRLFIVLRPVEELTEKKITDYLISNMEDS